MRARASAIPDALDALLVVLKADPAVTAAVTDVTDGAPVSAIGAPCTVLIVGGGPDPEDPVATTGERVDAGLGRGDDLETFDLTCHVEHWQGGDDTAAARRAAFTVLEVVKAALTANPTLNGAVARARLTGQVTHGTGHFQGETGAAITFTVRCQAL